MLRLLLPVFLLVIFCSFLSELEYCALCAVLFIYLLSHKSHIFIICNSICYLKTRKLKKTMIHGCLLMRAKLLFVFCIIFGSFGIVCYNNISPHYKHIPKMLSAAQSHGACNGYHFSYKPVAENITYPHSKAALPACKHRERQHAVVSPL